MFVSVAVPACAYDRDYPTSPPGALFRTLQFPFDSRPLSAIPPDSAVANKVWIVLVGGLYLGWLLSSFLVI